MNVNTFGAAVGINKVYENKILVVTFLEQNKTSKSKLNLKPILILIELLAHWWKHQT